MRPGTMGLARGRDDHQQHHAQRRDQHVERGVGEGGLDARDLVREVAVQFELFDRIRRGRCFSAHRSCPDVAARPSIAGAKRAL